MYPSTKDCAEVGFSYEFSSETIKSEDEVIAVEQSVSCISEQINSFLT